jgi:hypothetical protein
VVLHTYIPYLAIGDAQHTFEGEPFQELFSNFPFSSSFITGEWLLFDLQDPDGAVVRLEREIIDRIGFEDRQRGGLLDLGGGIGIEPFTTIFDVFSIAVAPSAVPWAATTSTTLATTVPDLAEQYPALLGDEDAADIAWQSGNTKEAVDSLRKALLESNRLIANSFYASLDDWDSMLSDSLQVRSYVDTPRVVILSQQITSDTLSVSLDLQRVKERAVVYPGQSVQASFLSRTTRGAAATVVEGQILESLVGESISVNAVFTQARQDDIPLIAINAHNLEDLEAASLSEEAKGRITHAVLAGCSVVVPAEMVIIHGVTTVGWLEIEQNGDLIGVMENGQHQVYLEYAFLALGCHIRVGPAGFTVGVFVFALSVLKGYFEGAMKSGPPSGKLSLFHLLFDAFRTAMAVCLGLPIMEAKGWCILGVNVAMKLSMIYLAIDPPLPDFYLARHPEQDQTASSVAPPDRGAQPAQDRARRTPEASARSARRWQPYPHIARRQAEAPPVLPTGRAKLGVWQPR